MPLYDFYAPFRPPLTDADKARIRQAEMKEKSEVITSPDDKNFDFIDARIDPVVREYMNIALEQAEKQFEGWPAYPEDPSTYQRYNSVDPEGKYSVIDMKFADRLATVKATLESRDSLVKNYGNSLLEWADTSSDMKKLRREVESLSKFHRKCTRAAKLCHDPMGSVYLQSFARSAEAQPSVKEMNCYIQGLEYISGVDKSDLTYEVKNFFLEYTQTHLLVGMADHSDTVKSVPKEISVEFQNLENRFKQNSFANPKNWGRPAAEVLAETPSLEEISTAIPAYACATANRVIDPLFKHLENRDATFSINRGDYIIVDGKTVHEKMFEEYIADGKDPGKFANFYKDKLKDKTAEYVSGALMTGKRVEVFLPDEHGNIPKEPTQITRKGYEPSPLNPVVMNAWENFWSKYGFYKSKAKAAEEYKRAADARERVKAWGAQTKMQVNSVFHPHNKSIFFSDVVNYGGELPEAVPRGYNVSRGALSSAAVCAMVIDGHSLQDIYDPTKLVHEKRRMGNEVLRRMKNGDHKWIAEKFFEGQRKIADFLDDAVKNVNIFDDKELFKDENQVLIFAAKTAFDANQEKKMCQQEYIAAGEKASPGHGAALCNEVDERVNVLNTYFDFGFNSLVARNNFAKGTTTGSDISTHLHEVVRFEATRKVFKEKMAASPKTPMSKLFTTATMDYYYGFGAVVMPQEACCDLSDKLENSEFQKAFGRSLLSGELQKNITVKVDPNMQESSFKINSMDKILAQTPAPKAPQAGRAM